MKVGVISRLGAVGTEYGGMRMKMSFMVGMDKKSWSMKNRP